MFRYLQKILFPGKSKTTKRGINSLDEDHSTNLNLTREKVKQIRDNEDINRAIDIIAKQNEEMKELRAERSAEQQKLARINEKMRRRTIDLFGRMVDLKKAKKTVADVCIPTVCVNKSTLNPKIKPSTKSAHLGVSKGKVSIKRM